MTSAMTTSSSGRHRGQEPSPSHDEPHRHAYADPSGAHSARPDEDATPPLLRVVRGEPTAEEIAALTVVVAALSQGRARRRPAPIGSWAAYAGTHRRPLRHGEGGWHTAGRPA
jgi:hypothetical protein